MIFRHIKPWWEVEERIFLHVEVFTFVIGHCYRRRRKSFQELFVFICKLPIRVDCKANATHRRQFMIGWRGCACPFHQYSILQERMINYWSQWKKPPTCMGLDELREVVGNWWRHQKHSVQDLYANRASKISPRRLTNSRESQHSINFDLSCLVEFEMFTAKYMYVHKKQLGAGYLLSVKGNNARTQ